MAYITAVKDSKVYWGEVKKFRMLDNLRDEVLPSLDFIRIHAWAVEPSWNNEHFAREYSDCDRELIPFVIWE